MRNREKYRRQAEKLVAQMTVEEAASQLLHHAPAIERLGVKEYNWWNEALHGVGRAGIATVFPQAIGMAAAFDPQFLKEEAEIIATEARAKYNAAQKDGDCDIYKGLTYWSPNINIFRDPRWGRGHETYGEDPTLTTQLGNAFIEGLQGDGEYLKLAACAKHFAVHSGPEALRHEFDAQATEKDLFETYLPAFESAVKEADVESVMGAYNRVNGEPACGHKRLLEDILRGEWGFEGHVLSDCWAVKDFHEHHKFTSRPAESASLAVRRGCDLNCGCTYERLMEGLKEGLITEEEIRRSAVRLFTTRYGLGMFDEDCEFNEIPYHVVNQPSHQKKALQAAEESIVLLKNDGILPLDKNALNSIGVIGPNAYSHAALYGNYYGDSDEYITNLDGIRREAGENIRIFYSKGCHLSKMVDDGLCRPNRFFSEVAAVGECSDVIVLCVGLDESLEGEEGDQGNMFASGDKEDLLLPEPQQLLIEKVLTLGKPVVLVINSGSALDLSAYESKVSAIVQSWYSGQRGGEALANILFGKTNPSGKLPLTFYYNAQPMPEFTDYHMAGRTYKFVEAAPWYPFGYGLSYTSFTYQNPQVKAAGSENMPVDEEQSHKAIAEYNLDVSVTIENTGAKDGAEIVEFYVRYEGETFEKPHHKLVGFMRVQLNAGEKKEIVYHIPGEELKSVQEDGTKVLLDGNYTLFIGTCQPDERSIALTENAPLAYAFTAEKGVIRAEEPVECVPNRYADKADYTAKIEKQKKFSLNTPLCELWNHEGARAAVNELVPFLFGKENPHADQLKGLNMCIKDIAGMAGGMFPAENLRKLAERLAEVE